MRHTLTLKRLLTLHSFLNEENVEKRDHETGNNQITDYGILG